MKLTHIVVRLATGESLLVKNPEQQPDGSWKGEVVLPDLDPMPPALKDAIAAYGKPATPETTQTPT